MHGRGVDVRLRGPSAMRPPRGVECRTTAKKKTDLRRRRKSVVLTSRSEQPPQCRWEPLGRTLIPTWVAFRSSDRQPRKGSVRRSLTVESLLGVLYRFGQIIGALPNMKVTPSRHVYCSQSRIERKEKTGDPDGKSFPWHEKPVRPRPWPRKSRGIHDAM